MAWAVEAQGLAVAGVGRVAGDDPGQVVWWRTQPQNPCKLPQTGGDGEGAPV